MTKVRVELTIAQLDDLLSNRISKMKPVVYFIRDNVVPVEEVTNHIPDLADLDLDD